ncbi:unnamed protein product, partial [Vitis vinifera]|uniref:Flavin-containing monooxygenase n=1 Tax=Vitis vinifera TaxID=29760 RepID=D7T5K5_VITVI
MSSSISALKSCNVAVIGAGPGGLVAARELRREGHKAVVFERQAQVGGTWEYQPSVEADPLASDPSRTIVHSSLYPSLRTNLPREVMGFRDYPFLSPGGTVEVVYTGLGADGKWRLRSRRGNDEEVDEIFDAVVVCNGHHTEPRIAEIHGIDAWPGKQMHSHNYRIPEPFRDQVVILIGNAFSADDISRDIAQVAKEVHVASRSVDDSILGK